MKKEQKMWEEQKKNLGGIFKYRGGLTAKGVTRGDKAATAPGNPFLGYIIAINYDFFRQESNKMIYMGTRGFGKLKGGGVKLH